jgi:hypothetical protein
MYSADASKSLGPGQLTRHGCCIWYRGIACHSKVKVWETLNRSGTRVQVLGPRSSALSAMQLSQNSSEQAQGHTYFLLVDLIFRTEAHDHRKPTFFNNATRSVAFCRSAPFGSPAYVRPHGSWASTTSHIENMV